jgi:phospholipid/cholesterol/gamma-HCH transport system substrate-binding protein
MSDSSSNQGPSEEEIRSAVPRERGGREVRIGIFVIAGVLSFILILFLLTDPATLRGRYMLVTEMVDAGGVRQGDPIQMRGVNIGRVNGFAMDDEGEVDITLEIEGEFRVPRGSRTQLTGIGLFGGRTLEVVPGESDTYYSEWDTIPGSSAGDDLFENADDIAQRAETVLDRVSATLDEPTVASLRSSVGELEALLSRVNEMTRSQRDDLEALTRSLRQASETLEETAETAGPDVTRTVARADSAMVTLQRASASLDEAAASLESILARMEAGEGTLGRLSRDDELYENLNRAAESVFRLSEDVRENPSRYINLSLF